MSTTFPQLHEPCAEWAASYREAQEPRSATMDDAKYRTALDPRRLMKASTRWEWLRKAYWHSVYRVRKAGGKIDRFPLKILEAIWQAQGGQCAWDDCTDVADRLDHITPVRVGGAHAADNFQFLCGDHNWLKGAKVYF